MAVQTDLGRDSSARLRTGSCSSVPVVANWARGCAFDPKSHGFVIGVERLRHQNQLFHQMFHVAAVDGESAGRKPHRVRQASDRDQIDPLLERLLPAREIAFCRDGGCRCAPEFVRGARAPSASRGVLAFHAAAPSDARGRFASEFPQRSAPKRRSSSCAALRRKSNNSSARRRSIRSSGRSANASSISGIR